MKVENVAKETFGKLRLRYICTGLRYIIIIGIWYDFRRFRTNQFPHARGRNDDDGTAIVPNGSIPTRARAQLITTVLIADQREGRGCYGVDAPRNLFLLPW